MFILILLVTVVVFVVGVAAALLGSRLKHPLSLAINLLLIGSLFWLLNVGGAEPGEPAGNGNPGIFLWVPVAVLGFVLLFQLCAASWLRRLNPVPLAAILLGLIMHQAVGFAIQRTRYRELRDQMMQVMAEPDNEAGRIAAEIRLGGIDSLLMSSHFFNLNTYLMFIGWITFAAAALCLAKNLINRRVKRESNPKGME